MDKHTLASELRECQRQLGQVPAFFFDTLPDDLIIDAYVTCHDCQARLVAMTPWRSSSARRKTTKGFWLSSAVTPAPTPNRDEED